MIRAQMGGAALAIDSRLKVVAALAMVLAVVLTPARAFGWFAAYTVLLAALMLILRVSPGYALKRSLAAVPLVLLVALPTPFLQKGPQGLVAFYGPGGLAVYQYGLLIFWNALIKAWLSLLSMTLLMATTPVPALLAALQQLRVPEVLVSQIAMIHRYGGLFTEELARMRRAAESRNFGGARSFRWKVIGQLVGSLFLRSYERGERVHAAMMARGYDGTGALIGTPGSTSGNPTSVIGRSGSAKPVSGVQDLVEPGGDCLNNTILEIRNLRFTYPDGTTALRGVDLDVQAGETVALLGPNGAGKSTLLLNLNGILKGEGFIRVAGEIMQDHNLRRIRQKVGLVFQNPDDQLFMVRAYEDVAFGPANAGLSAAAVEDRVKQALGQVGLAGYEERAAYHLSSGEKKRLSIATVLSMDIELLVLDEPSSNLDPRARRQLINLLRELQSAGRQGHRLTQMIATHDLPLVRELCPRSVILDGGKVVADGPTAELLRDRELLERHGLELPGAVF